MDENYSNSLKILQVSLPFHSRWKSCCQCILAILMVSKLAFPENQSELYTWRYVHMVPMAVPEVCCFTFESNSKKLFLSTNSALSTKSADGTFLSDLSSNFSYSAA